MKKQIIYLVLALLIAASSFGVVFAAQDNTAEPKASSDVINFVRDSSTEGTVTLSHVAIGYATSLKATFVLQEANFNSSTWTNSPVSPQYASKENSTFLNSVKVFQITNQKQYRVKVTLTDVVNGVTKSYSIYSPTI